MVCKFTIIYVSNYNAISLEIANKVKFLQTLHENGSNYKNHLNISAFKKYLSSKSNSNLVIGFIENDFPLWLTTHGKLDEYGNKLIPPNLSKRVNNQIQSLANVISYIDKISEETIHDDIEPINYDGYYYIMIFGVPKKDNLGFYTKTRVIRNGSYKDKNKNAINQYI